MTPQNEIRLKQQIEEFGFVALTVVPEEGEPTELKFSNFDEARNEINILENENEVFF